MRLAPAPTLYEKCYPDWLRDVAGLIVGAERGVTFGLYGRWGSGKTSACRALERRLYDAAHDAKKITVVVTLDAYALRNSPAELAHATLNRELEISVFPRKSDARQVKTLFDVIGRFLPGAVSAAPVPGAALGGTAIRVLAEKGSDAAQQRIDLEAKQVIDDLDADKVIVIIDDLDRCSPEDALRVLAQCTDPVMARAANVLIACDPEVLAAHASSVFGVSRTAGLEAISKYVHVPLYLPTGLTPAHAACFRLPQLTENDPLRPALQNAACIVTGIVPIREILAALPQATLWTQRLRQLYDEPIALELVGPVLYCAILAVILPDIVRAAQTSPDSFYRLSELVRKAGVVEKNALSGVLATFGNSIVDALRVRPDLTNAGRQLVPEWAGAPAQDAAKRLAYLVSGYATYSAPGTV